MPVGEDQAPLIEQTNEIVRRINTTAGRAILPEAQAVIAQVGRLPGVDGEAKMSKSGGNAIALSASPDEIAAAVKAMFTDTHHLRVEDPGPTSKAMSSSPIWMLSTRTAPRWKS